MRIDPIDAPAGSDVFIGAPASPIISQEATNSLRRAIADTPGVAEAHLPQIFAPKVSEAPTQALVLILARSAMPEEVMQTLGPKLHAIIPKGVHLDVWPLRPEHSLVPSVRKAGCMIWSAPHRHPWWKFWR
jgi:hypothetical protein